MNLIKLGPKKEKKPAKKDQQVKDSPTASEKKLPKLEPADESTKPPQKSPVSILRKPKTPVMKLLLLNTQPVAAAKKPRLQKARSPIPGPPRSASVRSD